MTGQKRKNSIKAMFGESLGLTPASEPAPETKSEKLTAVNEPEAAAATGAGTRVASGAIKAMGLSLASITREAEEARALRKAIEEGDRVVALETEKIVDSFVGDRLSREERDDPEFLSLVESMRDNGQQTPILVRPHPEREGFYQVAYGHRRLMAARRLGASVKAIVRPLSDTELIIAQGKENAERRNLTFIEKAVFARAIIEHGFDRKVAGDALAVQKSELSRLLQVAEAIPEHILRAIGPAPKAGRERWMALAALFKGQADRVKAQDEIMSGRFAKASTDERFQLLYDRLSRRLAAEKEPARALRAADGKAFAKLARRGKALRIDFAVAPGPRLVEALAEAVEAAYARFAAEGGE